MRQDYYDSTEWPRDGSRPVSLLAVVQALASAFVDGVVRPLERRREARRTYNTLMALDDRMLKDIGISRSDIPAIANDVWEDRTERPIAERGSERGHLAA